MVNILSVAIGAGFGLTGAVFGCWFTARRQDRMWMREQKLKAGVGFNTAVVQLIDYLRQTRLSDDDTVELAADLAGRVWNSRPSEGRDVRRAEHRETEDLLRRFTHQLRQEIART
ncbi:hypothetical protein [Streptomyces fuscichromogenes]|uniref:Uncharacterized protein n=1 Tax=Streptomyces fuscichromogenes TaxID=1324013 RepID=A0A918CT39_9ACTN|nr:hypothetical protein [Streptomyces fuscichromogenes]GGN22290.1 hypothetical protein GCM10011578_053960 [Streptomyces fuscichromogenes]